MEDKGCIWDTLFFYFNNFSAPMQPLLFSGNLPGHHTRRV